MNWNDPAQRLALIEAVGPEEYNRRHQAHLDRSTIETVNGYPLRSVDTTWGTLYLVEGTRMAFETLRQARQHARSIAPDIQNTAGRQDVPDTPDTRNR